MLNMAELRKRKTGKAGFDGIAIRLFILLFALSILPSDAFANNATAAYRSNTGACAGNLLNCPKIREWNSTGAGSWGSEVELATAGSPIRELNHRYSPISPKRIFVTQSDDGQLDAYVSFNGREWTVSNNLGRVWTTAPTIPSRRFDVDFESVSGDAIVIYSVENTGASCDLAYKVLPANESSFSGIAEQCINDATQGTDIQYSWVSLARDPVSSSEELVALGFDMNDSDVDAFVWNGNSWGNQQEITAGATATGGFEAFDAVYAADGSIAMAASSDAAAGNVATFTWNGAAWTNSTDFSVAGAGADNVVWFRLKADPSTDDIQAASIDGASDMATAYWNGTTWATTIDIDTGLDVNTSRVMDFVWDPTGSTGKLVWDTDTTGTTLSQRTCSPQCTGTTSTISTYAGTGRWISLFTNPTAGDSVNILGIRLNSNSDIGSFSWNGAAYANYGDGAFTADTTVSTFAAYGFDFQRAFDTQAPTFSNQDQSSDNIPQNGTVYLTAYWADSVQLDVAILETNETGTFQNRTTYGSPVNLTGNYSLVNFTWINASIAPGTVIGWRVYANDTSGNWNATPLMNFTVIRIYNFTVFPALDNFSVANSTFADRNYTINNTGNQVLDITCSDNATWVINVTACPTNLAAGSSANVTFRFNATGQPSGVQLVFLNFTNPNVSRNATANVTITAASVYDFTVFPTLDNFSVVNSTYIDRNFTLSNTGNQLLSINCSDNATWVTNITACPVSLGVGSSANVTFRFNATGRAVGTELVLLNFTNPNVSRNATANVTITAADLQPPTYANQSQSSGAIVQGGTVYLTVNWVDNVQLDTAILETNETGAFQNRTAYGSPANLTESPGLVNFTWSNASIAPGTVIGWRVYANDTSGNTNVTPLMSFKIVYDTNIPVIQSVSDSPDPVGQSNNITVTANVTDDTAVDAVWVDINGTNHTMSKADLYGSNTTQVPISCYDSSFAGGDGYELYSQWTIPGSGAANVTTIWYWQHDTSLGSGEEIEMAIYYSNGSIVPNSLINISGTGTSEWTNATYLVPVPITLGQDYYFGVGSTAGAAYNVPRDDGADCVDYPPNVGSYYSTPASGGLDSTVPTGSQSTNHYFFLGVTYLKPTGAIGSFTYNTSSLDAGIYNYIVYANDTSNNDAVPLAGNFTVVVPLNATLNASKSEYDACGTVFYEIETFDSTGSPVDSSLTVQVKGTSGTVMEETTPSTSGGALFASYVLPSDADFGAWLISVLAGGVFGERNFLVGIGSPSTPWKIDINFTPDQLVYPSATGIIMNFIPYNLAGEKMTGLLPSGISIQIDGTNVTSSAVELDGIYQYNYTTVTGTHVARATVQNVTNSRTFIVS
jgi:hypothetical protein